MRAYVAPLANDSRRVVRPVLSEGLDEGDRLHLLRPASSSDRSDDVVSDVDRILTQVVPDLDVVVESVPHSDFARAVTQCIEYVRVPNREIIVVLGGGPHEVLVPLSVAAFTNSERVDTILQMGDVDDAVRRVPRLNLRSSPSEAELSVLSGLSGLDTPLSISRIADELGTSKSTIARHVSSLESEQFVRTSNDGRRKVVELTDSARVLLRSL
jgi:CRISPR-associated protein Csa3